MQLIVELSLKLSIAQLYSSQLFMNYKASIFSGILFLYSLLFLNNAFSSELRLALVVGNSNYEFVPHLRNPINDANSIAEVLTQAGFSVILRNNLNQKQFKKAIREFGEQLPSADVGLFFYAGHAVQVNGRNYLIPVDARIQFESDIEIESVDSSSVLSKMEGSKTSLNLVILDSCRDNPFLTNTRSINNGLAFTVAPSGTLIAFSTAPGKYASDGDGENGLYTSYLIDYMKMPGLKIEDVFKQVRKAVRKETSGKQVPWESSSLEGDFYFFNQQKEVPTVITEHAIQAPSFKPPHKNTASNDPSLIDNNALEIDQKLAICDNLFDSNALYDASDDNALICYQNVLRIDKENHRATEGIEKIVLKYETSFEQELGVNKLNSAENSLAILRKISPNSEFVINAEQLLNTKSNSVSLKQSNNFLCSDLREKESFSGSMGFSELTTAERQFLYSQCD